MADLITMLTWNDVTVPNAKEVFLSAADAPCKHWGFKIEGTTPESFADLAATMKEHGKEVYIEVLAMDEEDCIRAAEQCIAGGAQHMLGTPYYPSVQKMLDEAYYAMPVDAKENEKGGYSVRDQRHESRAVLTDPEAVIWRVQFSERLRDEIEKGDFRNSFYVLTDDPENTQLWSYLVKDDRYRFCVWKVTDDSVLRGAYKSFSEGDLFYPGGVTYEKLGE